MSASHTSEPSPPFRQWLLIVQLGRGIVENKPGTVKSCINRGVDVNAIIPSKELTPLELAVKKRSVSMLQLLLDAGADTERKSTLGETIVITAIRYGDLGCVRILVERGADLNARTRDGETCLLLAMRFKHNSIADYLLDHDVCEVNEIGRYGLSALHYAVKWNKPDVMLKLIYKQADVNIRTFDGEVPVFIAAKRDALNLLRMLLEAGADPNIDTNDGDFALHEAAKQGNVKAVKLLLRHGADRERLDKSGMTPVELALALVPPLRDMIRCLCTYYTDYQEAERFAPVKSTVEGHDGCSDEDDKKLDTELEPSLCCPVTLDIMKDPVIAMDGHTYEREAIEQWIREKRQSPVTRQPMTSAVLIPNLSIKYLTDKFADMDSNS